MLGRRLGREHVDRGPRDLARVEPLLQSQLVDQPAARDVEDPHAVAHLGDRRRVDEPLRLLGLWQVNRDEVGARVDRVDVVGLLDADLTVELGRDVWIEGDHLHSEAADALRDELPDAPEADDPERLVEQLDAGELRALPLARDQRSVRLRDVAREREQQRDGVLGRRHDVRLWRVGDDDAAARRRRHVDIVDTDPRPPDHLQVAAALDQIGGHLRGRADQDPVELADPRGERVGIPIESGLDVEVLLEQLDARFADVLGDQHAGTRGRSNAVAVSLVLGCGRRAHSHCSST
jgi:hypothetical protein